MKRSRFTVIQIVSILKHMTEEQLLQTFVASMISAQPRWITVKRSMVALEANMLKRIKELEEENKKLKRMYADVSILYDTLKGSHREKEL